MTGKQLVGLGTVCLTALGVVAGVTVCVVSVASGIRKVIDVTVDSCCDAFVAAVEEIIG